MGNKKVRYFFLDNELHKVLSINRPTNLMVAWHYSQHKRVGYIYSDVRRKMGKAYAMSQVTKIIGRHRVTIERFVLEGHIRKPSRVYTLDGLEKPGKFFFSDKDIYEIHDYLLTVHRGRPRADGKITPQGVPSKIELRAMLMHDTAMYVKGTDGQFIQVWKETDW